MFLEDIKSITSQTSVTFRICDNDGLNTSPHKLEHSRISTVLNVSIENKRSRMAVLNDLFVLFSSEPSHILLLVGSQRCESHHVWEYLHQLKTSNISLWRFLKTYSWLILREWNEPSVCHFLYQFQLFWHCEDLSRDAVSDCEDVDLINISMTFKHFLYLNVSFDNIPVPWHILQVLHCLIREIIHLSDWLNVQFLSLEFIPDIFDYLAETNLNDWEKSESRIHVAFVWQGVHEGFEFAGKSGWIVRTQKDSGRWEVKWYSSKCSHEYQCHHERWGRTHSCKPQLLLSSRVSLFGWFRWQGFDRSVDWPSVAPEWKWTAIIKKTSMKTFLGYLSRFIQSWIIDCVDILLIAGDGIILRLFDLNWSSDTVRVLRIMITFNTVSRGNSQFCVPVVVECVKLSERVTVKREWLNQLTW